jgi:hypothetical protein
LSPVRPLLSDLFAFAFALPSARSLEPVTIGVNCFSLSLRLLYSFDFVYSVVLIVFSSAASLPNLLPFF